MSKEFIPHIATHPGEVLKDELTSRNIKQREFAAEIGMQPTMLNEIINGKRAITPQIAIIIEKALQIEADFWLNVQSQYELDTERIKERTIKKLQTIEVWQMITKYVPVKYFRKEGFLTGVQEKDIALIKDIYKVSNIEGIAENIGLQKSMSFFRKSSQLQVDEINLLGWSKLAAFKAKQLKVNSFDTKKLPELKKELRKLFFINQNTKKSTKILLENYGVKLVFLQKFDKTPVDGYSFISGNNPSIALTLRHKRIDNFAFTIMHELGHIEMHLGKNNESEFIDFYGKGIVKNDKEIEADNYAKELLISASEWEDFIKNFTPYTDEKILRFSEKYEIHPYIVFGRISHEMNFYARKTDLNKEIK